MIINGNNLFRGFFGAFDYDAGAHHFQVGGWWEHNDFNQARRFYALASRSAPGLSFRDYPKNPFFTQWDIDAEAVVHSDVLPAVARLAERREVHRLAAPAFVQIGRAHV